MSTKCGCKITTFFSRDQTILGKSAENQQNWRLPPIIILSFLHVVFKGPRWYFLVLTEPCRSGIFSFSLQNDSKYSILARFSIRLNISILQKHHNIRCHFDWQKLCFHHAIAMLLPCNIYVFSQQKGRFRIAIALILPSTETEKLHILLSSLFFSSQNDLLCGHKSCFVFVALHLLADTFMSEPISY